MLDIEIATLSLTMKLEKHYDEEFKQLKGHCKVILRQYTEDFDELVETIGEIEFSLFHLSRYDEDLGMLSWEAEAQSEDKNKLIDDFLHFIENSHQSDLISFITIDEMRINQEYQSKGLGEQALRELIDLGMYMNIDYFILQPAPLDKPDIQKDAIRTKQIKQIARFYEKVDFHCYQRMNMEPIMIYNECLLRASLKKLIKSKDIVSILQETVK